MRESVSVREQEADHLHGEGQSDEAHDHVQDEHLSDLACFFFLVLMPWRAFRKLILFGCGTVGSSGRFINVTTPGPNKATVRQM